MPARARLRQLFALPHHISAPYARPGQPPPSPRFPKAWRAESGLEMFHREDWWN
jgi:hypothetical protein